VKDKEREVLKKKGPPPDLSDRDLRNQVRRDGMAATRQTAGSIPVRIMENIPKPEND
jgi:hypothetical protein